MKCSVFVALCACMYYTVLLTSRSFRFPTRSTTRSSWTHTHTHTYICSSFDSSSFAFALCERRGRERRHTKTRRKEDAGSLPLMIPLLLLFFKGKKREREREAVKGVVNHTYPIPQKRKKGRGSVRRESTTSHAVTRRRTQVNTHFKTQNKHNFFFKARRRRKRKSENHTLLLSCRYVFRNTNQKKS